ncbi:cytochrome o ubiquinol/quinol oxidase subunit IV [Chlamydiota bacterium]
MHKEPDFNEIQKEWHGTLQAYLIGLGASLFLTGAAYLLVIARAFITREVILLSLIGLAAFQATAQVLFFLHVGEEAKPRWETLVFLFMLLVLLIVVVGTLWIMSDLNHRLMG